MSKERDGTVAVTTKHDHDPATKADVDRMITERIGLFHGAMVERGQIRPIPTNPEDRVPLQV